MTGSPVVWYEFPQIKAKKEETIKEILRFLKDEEGVTAIEYALIAGFIALVIIVAVSGIGSKLNTTFSNVQAHIP